MREGKRSRPENDAIRPRRFRRSSNPVDFGDPTVRRAWILRVQELRWYWGQQTREIAGLLFALRKSEGLHG